MAHFGLRINKTQAPDKTPYTIYYPHSTPSEQRNWKEDYYQVVSIDPAVSKNYALRIERRYFSGHIVPIVFDKTQIEQSSISNGITLCETYNNLTNFLDKYKEIYYQCHFVFVERQLPQNYKATRVGQHTISYFNISLKDKPLCPTILEVDPKLKGKMLGVPKGISDKQLKVWAIEKARELLAVRGDNFSLSVMNHFSRKQDDLADTVVQIEAIFILWGFKPTVPINDLPKLGASSIPHKLNINQQTEGILKLVQTAPKQNNDSIQQNNIPPVKLKLGSTHNIVPLTLRVQ